MPQMESVKACKMVPGKREALLLLSGPVSFVQQISVETLLGVRWFGVGCPEESPQSCRGTGSKCGNNSLSLSFNPHNPSYERSIVDAQGSDGSGRPGRLPEEGGLY